MPPATDRTRPWVGSCRSRPGSRRTRPGRQPGKWSRWPPPRRWPCRRPAALTLAALLRPVTRAASAVVGPAVQRPGLDFPASILSRKAPQSWGKHVSVPPVLFLESRTRTYCPSQATSTYSLPLAPDLALFRQVRASGRPGAAVGCFPGVQEETCSMVALLMSPRADFPLA